MNNVENSDLRVFVTVVRKGSFGFGRKVVAPVIAQLAASHPRLRFRNEVLIR